MIPAINYALSALQASERRVGVHANNVANVNTTAFKSSRALQSSVYPGGTRISAIQRDFSQGSLDLTQRETDAAINGPGFFALEGGGYTRDGSFNYNANGELVTTNGRRVLPGQIDQVPNPDGLTATGSNQFDLSAVAGQAFPSSSSIVNGVLEASNVDIATETVGTILAQRAFEFNVASIRTADEMTGTLLNMSA